MTAHRTNISKIRSNGRPINNCSKLLIMHKVFDLMLQYQETAHHIISSIHRPIANRPISMAVVWTTI